MEPLLRIESRFFFIIICYLYVLYNLFLFGLYKHSFSFHCEFSDRHVD